MRDGVVERFQIDPADYGYGHQSGWPRGGLRTGIGGRIRRALTGDGDPDAIRAAQLLPQCRAGIMSGRRFPERGVVAAEEATASGAALDKLDAFADFTQQTVAASS